MLPSHTLFAATALLAPITSAIPYGDPQQQPQAVTAATPRLTVYWGAEDDTTTLADVCSDPSYDIVTLAFVSHFFADGGFPRLSLSSLSGPSQAQIDAGATALQDATSLADAVHACQSAGKLVILSTGGANEFADVRLGGDEQGVQIADTLWNLFLGGENRPELRPFGEDVKLDGIDLDNESGDATGYNAMVARLRANMASDPSKTYYLTAAPQCPFPDQSIPLDVCSQLDYVWVQFYNNGDCNVAQSGFQQAVRNWSEGIGGAQLFVGALASGADGDEGYVDAQALVSAIDGVKGMGLANFGGAMLWEAQLAVNNDNYQRPIKESL